MRKKEQKYQFNPTILRAYDARGIVGETLSTEDAYYLGKSFGTFVIEQGKGKRICVGFDGRLSSPDLEEALVKGLVTTGAEVIRVGLGPTPLLYFAVRNFEAAGGIMVTGSHNPPNHNGFKMMLDKLALYGDDIQQLGVIAAQGSFIEGSGSVTFEDIGREYIKSLLLGFEPKDSELKIAWDAGNGAAGNALRDLVPNLPGNHILINEIVDGTFPSHHPDPSVPENLQELIEVVKKEKCDIGFAFDGDGDRVGVIDENGDMVWVDQMLIIFALDVLKRKPGSTIIADVKTSQIVFDEIEKAGGKPLMWKTGHSLVKAKMAELNSPFAGEMSGHIFFADHYGFDDGLYAAVKLFNIIAKSGLKLSQITQNIPKSFSTPEMRIDVEESRKFQIVEEIRKHLEETDYKVNDIDGVRVKTDDGWWLVRASNTQAALIARCESESENGLENLKLLLKDQLNKSGVKI
ncbi:phosphomannomutase/phosphoglucomutase [Rickettsiales bacterium]|nr:phosphomannomutase/phosphoglucomutase [Rickettsiales bacterium]